MVAISPEGLAHGDRPGVRRAHHDAFKHGLAADQGLFTTFERRQKLHGHEKSHMLRK